VTYHSLVCSRCAAGTKPKSSPSITSLNTIFSIGVYICDLPLARLFVLRCWHQPHNEVRRSLHSTQSSLSAYTFCDFTLARLFVLRCWHQPQNEVRRSLHSTQSSLSAHTFCDLTLARLFVLLLLCFAFFTRCGILLRYGTNPMAFGWPRDGYPPLVWDQASSAMARGEVELARQAGRELPPGVGIGPDGEPSTDPTAVLAGCQLPFGGFKVRLNTMSCLPEISAHSRDLTCTPVSV
jgi:hypothetical protein